MNVLYKISKVFKRVDEKENTCFFKMYLTDRLEGGREYKRIDFLQLCATIKIIKSFVLSLTLHQ